MDKSLQLLYDYNELRDEFNAFKEKALNIIEIGYEGVKRAYVVDGNSNSVFEKEAKALLFEFADKAEELLKTR